MSAIVHPSKPAVLVVEDEALLRMDAVDLIEAAGYEVFEACDADEAVMILEESPAIGVIFTDIDMPGSMNGIGLAHLVRQRWPDVKIVMTSGHRKIDDVDFLEEGRFLAKPYPAEVVTKALEDVASGS